MPPPIALSVAQSCRTYGVGRSTAYGLIAAGVLEAKKAGAKTLIDRASAERWYASLPRSCYLPFALTKARGTPEPVQLLAQSCTDPSQKGRS